MLIDQAATRFPSDVYETYASYKRDTAKIIHWLSSQVYGAEAGRTTLTHTRELLDLAGRVAVQDVEVPDDVMHLFRRTIAARKELTRFYHASERQRCYGCTATESHQSFNEILEEAYHMLSKLASRECSGTDRNARTTCAANARRIGSRNGFSCLQASVCDEEETTALHVERAAAAPAEAASASPSAEAARESRGGGTVYDALDELSYIYTHLLQLDHLMSLVKDSYRRAATGEIPLVVCAATTNLAYELGRWLCSGFGQAYQLHNPEQLRKRYCKMVDDLDMPSLPRPAPGDTKAPQHLLFTQAVGPHGGWKALCEYKQQCMKPPKQPTCGCGAAVPVQFPYDDPVALLGLGGMDDGQEKPCQQLEHRFMMALIRGMHQTTNLGPEMIPGIDTAGTSLSREVRAFLSGASEDPGWGMAFGLHLMLEAYRSYCEAIPQHGPLAEELAKRKLTMHARTPRLQTLGLALSIKTRLGNLIQSGNMPCDCLTVKGRIVAHDLVGCHRHLDAFVSTKRFDLFSQCPWTCGQHALENLTRANVYGAYAWHHGYHVGTLLHIYNALVRIGKLSRQQMPALEQICALFEETVLLGSRRTACNSALGCWQRWTGGRLKLSSAEHGSGSHSITQRLLNAGERRRKWDLCHVPDPTHGGETDRRRFCPSRVSLFGLLSEEGVVSPLDDRFLAWAYLATEKRRNSSPKDTARAARAKLAADGPYFARYLERVQDKLLGEFCVPVPTPREREQEQQQQQRPRIPVARLSYIAVYGCAIETMRRICDATHDADPGYICLCTAQDALWECDAVVKASMVARGKKRGSSVAIDGKTPACEACTEQLVAVWGDKRLEDFLWDI